MAKRRGREEQRECIREGEGTDSRVGVGKKWVGGCCWGEGGGGRGTAALVKSSN